MRMAASLEVLALVQARGGSKGLPNKNVAYVGGHPLLAYSIASAQGAKAISRTIVSSDSEAILEVARAYGAETPFRRPAAIAADDTPDLPVFEHALTWLWEHERYRPDIVVQLRPTTPLRPIGMVDEAIALLQSDPEADCVRGVTNPKQTPYKMWRRGQGPYLSPLLETEWAEPYNMPRQKLPEVLWQTGHIDVIWSRTITEQHSLTGRRVLPLLLDPRYCIDIDSAADLDAVAEAIAGGELTLNRPGKTMLRPYDALPEQIDLIVFDFDGIFTDNRVFVTQDGVESVVCNRGDGLGISLLRQCNLPLFVLSTETNPIVSARCRKLDIECWQGLDDKSQALRQLVVEKGASLSNTIYVGNDLNDLDCLKAVGCAVVPADANSSVRPYAHLILTRAGGKGAIRELCDLILKKRAAYDEPTASS